MIKIKNPGKILTFHTHTTTPVFNPEQKFCVFNFRKDHFYTYNNKYIIREKE